jgi:FixJ family two-component response regulator
MMRGWTQEVERRIARPLGKYRSEKEPDMVLMRRLTRKEYKLLSFLLDDPKNRETVQKRLNLSPLCFEDLCQNITKKLNLDRIKQELFHNRLKLYSNY